jgi:outer membrane receptor protein involved in Fe transport
MQTMYGAQLRNDDVGELALYHTDSRIRLDTISDASATVTSAGMFAQGDIEWSPKLRITVGARADGTRFKVTANDPANSGIARAGILSPKAAVTIGPWRGTEVYVNGGTGFHSNNALGTTITRDGVGNPLSRVTPLVRAKGAEVGVRTVAVPHLQTTVALWMLRLGSELVYNGDVGATEPGPASSRRGIELANYYSPKRWLVFDGDVSWSRARFTDASEGAYVPEAVGLVVSAGASVDHLKKASGSVRLRYFGPRTLIEDNSVKSAATTLTNVEGGYELTKHLRASLQIYNLFDAKVSDIDYYFASRLRGEPLEGVEDIHTHPAVLRTARLSLIVGF